MSTHGRTGPSRWLLGSVADRVVRGAGDAGADGAAGGEVAGACGVQSGRIGRHTRERYKTRRTTGIFLSA